MEVLTVFFEAIDNILIGYTKRGKCELPEFLAAFNFLIKFSKEKILVLF